MCDVVIAAAQTLTLDDLSLLTETDLPSQSGLVMLPQPLLVRRSTAILATTGPTCGAPPIQMPKPATVAGGWDHVPAVRTILDFAAQARAQGHPLPPLLLGCHALPPV